MINFATPFSEHHLSRRFLVFLFSVLSIISLAFLLVFFYFYNEQLTEERTQASESVSLLLKSSLERAMLRRDLVGLQEIVSDLGNQPGIAEVFILNPQGEIRFASNIERLGENSKATILEFCPHCTEEHPPIEAQTQFTYSQQGKEILRTFYPVKNKSECMTCHGTTQAHPINGILVVDHDAAPIRQKGWVNIFMLIGAGSVALLLSAWAAWWFMQHYVLTPIHALDQASRSLAQGDLNARVPINSQDEMGHLAQVFNHMAETLQKNHHVLKNREAFLQGLIDAIPDGVRVINTNYEVVAANQVYAEQMGIATPQQLRLRRCYELTFKRDTPCPSSLRTCPLHELSVEKHTIKFMENQIRVDGSTLPTEVYAALLQTEASNHRESEFLVVEAIRDLEKAMHYSHEQKLASLGELAAGVAHEIHNPLASIRIALQASDQILADTITDTTEIKDYLHLVDEKVEQCLDVTRRLMKMGTLASEYPELLDVNVIIRETLSLLRFEREQIGIQEKLLLAQETLRIVAADNNLRMIILNLAQNAFHAMPQGGVFTIQTKRLAGRIHITIQDTGLGIADDILPHIFDPFFSRRHNQRGSGLGLTIALTLTKQHGGQLQVLSHQPGNTTFLLDFPDADVAFEEAL